MTESPSPPPDAASPAAAQIPHGGPTQPNSPAGVPAVTIKVRRDGPLLITGPVRIVDPQGGEWCLPEGPNVALCRCGHSAQRPFCDGRHRELPFAANDHAPPSPPAPGPEPR
ncbi:MAG: CDGSH iron-sulfur domain-containing protein [Planctomycetaceae bacterium]